MSSDRDLYDREKRLESSIERVKESDLSEKGQKSNPRITLIFELTALISLIYTLLTAPIRIIGMGFEMEMGNW